jgi:hypothetical protein
MPLRELPVRPNLDNLKKQAKSLLDAAQAHDHDALGRFAILPALAGPRPLRSSHQAATAGVRDHGSRQSAQELRTAIH